MCIRVPVDSVVCLQMVFSNVIDDVTVPRRSSVFSQSNVQICGLAVAAFDLINCSLSVLRLFFVFDVSPSSFRQVVMGQTTLRKPVLLFKQP